MARVAKTAGATATTSANGREKLTVVEVLGQLTFDNVTVRKNSNGKDYIPTPHGAVYSKIDEIQEGVIYSAVQLSNGAIALNVATGPEKMKFLNGLKSEYANMSIADIKDCLGIK